MAIILRQICLVARDLEPVRDALEETFSLKVCYKDPDVGQFGLENILMPVGSQFLEVVTPIKADAPAVRFLDRRGGDSGYMVICQTTEPHEQAAIRARAVDLGIRIVLETTLEGHSFLQFHPADMGGSFLEADWDALNEPQGRWAPANERAWTDFVDTSRVQAIAGATLEAQDPAAVASAWSTVLGLPAQEADGGTFTIALANATLHFHPLPDGTAPGLAGITLKKAPGTDLSIPHADIGGVRIDLE